MAFLTLDAANTENVGTALTTTPTVGRNPTFLVLNVATGPAIASEASSANGIEATSHTPFGSNRPNAGIKAWSDFGPGVVATGAPGVAGSGGLSLSNPTVGVGVQGTRIGLGGGPGTYLIGVSGEADNPYWGLVPGTRLIGVSGNSSTDMGVVGGTDSGTGVVGDSGRSGIGVLAIGNDSNYALVTQPGFSGHGGPSSGDVWIQGALIVTGAPKSAAVKLRDGSHRALYCVESPECWFEDFGRARLVRGKARVRLDRMFAAVVRTSDYHIFLSPEGLSHGLYVSGRTRDGFDVREQHRGTSTVRFSYRIVARRKDVVAPRFKRVKLPIVPKFTRPPTPPISRQIARPTMSSDLKKLLSRMERQKSPTTKQGTRRSRTR